MFRMFPAALMPLRRVAPLLLATMALAGLVACGGSTSRVESFDPSRLVVFGDELSVIGNGGTAALQGYTEPAGAKYTVNALDDDGTALNCSSSLIWVQVLASNYGLPLGPCMTSGDTQRGWIAAQAGARVADVAAQVAAFQDAPLVADTLVTVVAGLHDILDAYDAVVAGSFNLGGPVLLRVIRLGRDTRFAQIVALMESASTTKPRDACPTLFPLLPYYPRRLRRQHNAPNPTPTNTT